MRRPLSLSYLTVTGLPPPAHVGCAAAAGFDFVGLRLVPALDDEAPYPMDPRSPMMRETRARLHDSGVGVFDIELIKLDRHRDPRVYVPVFESAALLGARNVLVTSADPVEDENVQRLAALCELGRDYSLHFHVEFMPWARGVPTLQSAERIVRGSGANNAHIIVDAIHFDRTDGTFDALRDLPAQRFRYVQLCDAPAARPATPAAILEQGRFERLLPGEGELPLRRLLETLPAAIPISVEAPARSFAGKAGFQALANRACRATKALVEHANV